MLTLGAEPMPSTIKLKPGTWVAMDASHDWHVFTDEPQLGSDGKWHSTEGPALLLTQETCDLPPCDDHTKSKFQISANEPRPDPGPGYRLLAKEPVPELVIEGDEYFAVSKHRSKLAGVWKKSYNWRVMKSQQSPVHYYRRKIETPMSTEPMSTEPTPAEPKPVAPTEPGLYPLADGTTVYLIGPYCAGDWVGIKGDFTRCWRYDGRGRGVPDVIGPRIPEPIDNEAAIARVNELAAAGELEVRARSSMTDPDKYTNWSLLGTGYQFRHIPKRSTISPPPDDWPPEIKQAAIEQAKKHGLEVVE